MACLSSSADRADEVGTDSLTVSLPSRTLTFHFEALLTVASLRSALPVYGIGITSSPAGSSCVGASCRSNPPREVGRLPAMMQRTAASSTTTMPIAAMAGGEEREARSSSGSAEPTRSSTGSGGSGSGGGDGGGGDRVTRLQL
jgi:uncharacterized membrane protein YgcG